MLYTNIRMKNVAEVSVTICADAGNGLINLQMEPTRVIRLQLNNMKSFQLTNSH
jgi:hypothetical protein